MAFRAGAVSAAIAILAASAPAAIVRAADLDPAAAQITSFDSALIAAMKEGSATTSKARAHKLTPTVEQTFDIPAMIRIAVGAPWTGMSDADHAALTDSFKRLTAATYAHNFASYDGEKLEVDPKVVMRGSYKVVQTRLIPAGGDPVVISYLMHDAGGNWKVVDVYFQGAISQMTTRRSDYAATVAAGGAKALIANIDAQTDKLLR
jgi:phospholipid transport system substrate-binding protein